MKVVHHLLAEGRTRVIGVERIVDRPLPSDAGRRTEGRDGIGPGQRTRFLLLLFLLCLLLFRRRSIGGERGGVHGRGRDVGLPRHRSEGGYRRLGLGLGDLRRRSRAVARRLLRRFLLHRRSFRRRLFDRGRTRLRLLRLVRLPAERVLLERFLERLLDRVLVRRRLPILVVMLVLLLVLLRLGLGRWGRRSGERRRHGPGAFHVVRGSERRLGLVLREKIWQERRRLAVSAERIPILAGAGDLRIISR
mmetsp:Transcript_45608/g.84551  ORF Transcript_45608/g.84551 Transcript_45608/m.84551 type:complete len:249 (+) Transcript_45608:2246-2992(+)